MEPKVCQYFHALHQVAVDITSSLDPRVVPEAIVRSIAEAVGAKACSILLLAVDRQQLCHMASFGLSPEYMGKGPVLVDRSMADALDGHPVAVRDVRTDPRIQYAAEAVREGIASILSVPIRLREEVVGVVRVYSSEPRQFTIEDVEFVEAAANLGAIALENARRHEDVQYRFDMVSRYVYRDAWVEQLSFPG